jgi:hypothetical protein
VWCSRGLMRKALLARGVAAADRTEPSGDRSWGERRMSLRPQRRPEDPFNILSKTLSAGSHLTIGTFRVRTGVMSYGSFWTHVGRSGDMSDTA